MSETGTTETDNTPTTDVEEPSAEAWDALAKGTANTEYEDALRPPSPHAGEAEVDAEQEDDGDADGDGYAAEGDGEGGRPSREAKLRHRAQTAEAERDGLATQLAAMQRSAIDSHVTGMGMKPAALWASGAKLEDLLGEDGVPDEKKVQAAAQAAKETLGVQVYTRPRAGLQSGAMATQPQRDKWTAAFGPRDQ